MSLARQIFTQATTYDTLGDVYHTVKLCKRAIKLDPDYAPPYLLLGRIYHERQEWKPCLYYHQQYIALKPRAREVWPYIGLAAAALGKWAVAREAWRHEGYALPDSDRPVRLAPSLIGIRCKHRGKQEILWARRLDPVRAELLSLPQLPLDLNYGDTLLFDLTAVGDRMLPKGRIAIHPYLARLERRFYTTYRVRLYTESAAPLDTLERLCSEAQLGFDNWSAATRQITGAGLTEYYGQELLQATEHIIPLVGIAVRHREQLEEVLEAWRVITFCEWEMA